MAEAFLGEIRMFGGNFAPQGWAMCNGQLLSISQNTALFSLLGTYYGGDGQTTFGLPDFRGRAPLSQGQGPALSAYTLGERGGTENVTLNANQLPPHAHPLNVPSSSSAQNTTATDPAGSYPGATTTPSYAPTSDGQMGAGKTGLNPGGQATPILQPFLCVTFIIALQGIYPSRN